MQVFHGLRTANLPTKRPTMRLSFPSFFRTSALTGALLLCVPLASGQNSSEDYFKAYYHHHETGQIEKALALYKSALGTLPKNHELRDKAQAAIAELKEDLFCSDLTRLMPPETIFYAELGQPGQQLRQLTESLGLLNTSAASSNMGVSSKLFDSTLNLRGAALAVTAIDYNGGPPSGVLVLHPGNQDSVRGLLETVMGNGGLPTEPISGASTWSIENQVFITATSRLWIASTSRDEIRGVVERLNGEQKDSFANVKSLKNQRENNPNNLVFFHLRAEPILPQVRAMLEHEAQSDPQLAMAMDFIDVDSLVGVTGQLGMDKEGLGLKVTLELAEDHRNLAFNLMRLPALKPSTLEHIPAGASFVVAAALNEKAAVAPVSGTQGQPIVTALDFGREVFGNVVDICLFGLPGDKVSLIPEVAISLRVNDAKRSRAIWNFVLGLAKQSSGSGDMQPVVETVLGQEIERYSIKGLPVYLMMNEGELLLTPSKGLVQRTITARKEGRTALKDELLAGHIRSLGDGTNLALLASPARLAKMGRFYIPSSKREEVQAVAGLLENTVLRLGFRQTGSELGLDLKIANLPNVQPLLAQLRAQELGGGFADQLAAQAPVETPEELVEDKDLAKQERNERANAKREQRKAEAAKRRAAVAAKEAANAKQEPADSQQQLLESFEGSVANGDAQAAQKTLKKLAKAAKNDASKLNEYAWRLMTEDHYESQFKAAALKMAERSHELSEGKNWMFLDTYALAEYQNGNLQRAVELGETAYKLAGNSGRAGEVLENLKLFKSALAKASQGKVGLR